MGASPAHEAIHFPGQCLPALTRLKRAAARHEHRHDRGVDPVRPERVPEIPLEVGDQNSLGIAPR